MGLVRVVASLLHGVPDPIDAAARHPVNKPVMIGAATVLDAPAGLPRPDASSHRLPVAYDLVAAIAAKPPK